MASAKWWPFCLRINVFITMHPLSIEQAECPMLHDMFNILRPRQNGRHFADDTFKRIFMNENVKISINISLKFVPKSLINNIPALVRIMAWHRPGDKPLSEPMMGNLLMHICVTRPQWVKACDANTWQHKFLVVLPVRVCTLNMLFIKNFHDAVLIESRCLIKCSCNFSTQSLMN